MCIIICRTLLILNSRGQPTNVYTVEPLNKGHLRTEGIVPYLEVVPYWEVLHKK